MDDMYRAPINKDDINIDKINLDVVWNTIKIRLEKEDILLNNLQVGEVDDPMSVRMGEHIAVMVKYNIAKQDLEPVTIKYPLNWVQAIKERFAPLWYTKRYPVKYKTVVVGAGAFYDKIAIPEHSHYVTVNILNP